MLSLGLEYPQCNYCESEHMEKDELVKLYYQKLIAMKEMLEDYFKIKITDDGKLCSLPKLVKEIPPYVDLLPLFLVKLAAEVDYNTEEK